MLKNHTAVRGVLLIEGYLFCYTLEHPDLFIPDGKYRCVLRERTTRKYPDRRYEIMHVKNRTNILIHKGNTLVDTTGCVLLGKSIGKMGSVSAVFKSGDTIDLFMGIMNGEESTINN